MSLVPLVYANCVYRLACLNPRSNFLTSPVFFITGEAVMTVSKATELFLQFLVRHSLDIMNVNNRKSVKIEDLLIMCQCNKFRRQLEFLDDAFGPIQ